MIEFQPFPKIARFSREIVITEKIDGTNGQVFITENGQVLAGSRNRWVTPTTDNFGFAAWVEANQEDLLKLGPGAHFGEWWGRGIQRGYGIKDRRFSLFNVSRWGDASVRPACCGAVPTLYTGVLGVGTVEKAIADLMETGSHAAPFMDPEGIIIYHTASRQLFKKTIEGDESPKSATGGAP